MIAAGHRAKLTRSGQIVCSAADGRAGYCNGLDDGLENFTALGAFKRPQIGAGEVGSMRASATRALAFRTGWPLRQQFGGRLHSEEL
jgi:hypothetical protein